MNAASAGDNPQTVGVALLIVFLVVLAVAFGGKNKK